MSLVKRNSLLNIIFFVIPFASGVAYLMAFYPGIMTFDSLSQWHQVSSFQFENWHPAYHSILIWLVTRFRDTLAAFALFQIIVFSGVLAYGLRTFKNIGLPSPLLILLAVLISIIPMNGLLMVTIWKDVLYGTAVLLLTILLLKVILSKGRWLANSWNSLLLGITIANVSLLRHNGFPVAFGTLLVIGLVFTKRKWAFLSLFTALLYMGIINGPVYDIFKVKRDQSQSLGILFIHPIAAHINNGAIFTPDEEAYLNQIFHMDVNWPYSCYDATVLFYRGVNFKPVQDDPLKAANIFFRLTLNSPLSTARHFKCLSSFVWQIPQPHGVYLETVITENIDARSRSGWQKYQLYVEQKSRAPQLRSKVIDFLVDYSRADPYMIGWRPAIYLYLYSAAVLFCAWRKKNALILLLLVPVYLQTGIIAISAQLQAVRYQYPVYLISMLFTIPLLFIAGKSSTTSHEL